MPVTSTCLEPHGPIEVAEQPAFGWAAHRAMVARSPHYVELGEGGTRPGTRRSRPRTTPRAQATTPRRPPSRRRPRPAATWPRRPMRPSTRPARPRRPPSTRPARHCSADNPDAI